MSAVYVAGQRITLNPANLIGKGGEADVYDPDGKQVTALKVYKEPDHPDYTADKHAQKGAKERLDIHQRKLPGFPKGLPREVVFPTELATDKGGRIVGYTMPFLRGMEVLMRYADRGFRQSGIDANIIPDIFTDLHGAVRGLHQAGIVLGDFNDLNVMVKGSDVRLVDADSYQFTLGTETFYCTTFTQKFVDPMICDPSQSALVMNQPHNQNTDWYAFAVMFMNCLLYVDPYGGVFKPSDPKKRVNHDARPLHRVTVFHPEVKYPKPAIPYNRLPDDLLQAFHRIFEKDERGEFPLHLVLGVEWRTCATCGAEYARGLCPECNAYGGQVKTVTQVTGTVTATRIFKTEGTILYADWQGGKLRWIAHENGKLTRDGERPVANFALDPQTRFRIRGEDTIIAKPGMFVVLSPKNTSAPVMTEPADNFGILPVVDANGQAIYWMKNGQLRKSAALGSEYVGDALQNQTLFWVGADFGFGFYRASAMTVGFVFDTTHAGINDSVKLPPIKGQLVDATCVFSSKYAWFLVATQDGGKTINQCILVQKDGQILGAAQAEAGDGSWLGTLRGKCAVGNFLFVATDDGLVRVELQGKQLEVTKSFPDTEPYVDSGHQIFPGTNGLHVVGRQEIHLIKMS